MTPSHLLKHLFLSSKTLIYKPNLLLSALASKFPYPADFLFLHRTILSCLTSPCLRGTIIGASVLPPHPPFCLQPFWAHCDIHSVTEGLGLFARNRASSQRSSTIQMLWSDVWNHLTYKTCTEANDNANCMLNCARRISMLSFSRFTLGSKSDSAHSVASGFQQSRANVAYSHSV